MSAVRRGLLAEALLWLAVSRLALWTLPFRAIVAHLGNPVSPVDVDRHAALLDGGPDDERLIHDIGWAVRRMAVHVPFTAVCLDQAIAAKIMLRRRGIPSMLYFGIASGESLVSKLHGHAWLDTANVKVTGYPVEKTLTKVACYL